ncbi:AraC family transcriptional regulator [Enterovibrio sp. ZSDZ35]|uniref:AraC family transcriptional regulator n=1 Tax=Enterovibrio qingdaonensis TaxID=2899818 RepID=A0ABT5QMT6_9GAMM|nr:AraC family transcriptional regulator [Enterovibrio sp. ZSDZ35]MDD1781904.1 AraC family transcriptional regulator [Enterovibrio sp. ZSDZ35]
MTNTLSIRAYTKQTQNHTHGFHQLVLPIQGSIHIALDSFSDAVSVGECVVIKAGTEHHFRADDAARFIVVDLDTLPPHISQSEFVLFAISPPLLSFVYFAEKQLEFQVDSKLEMALFSLFYLLLEQQEISVIIDSRIRRAQAHILEHIESPLTIKQLADIACLSPTQFKKRFKETVGETVHQYIVQQRIEKAKALLTHTDLPIQIVAERVGYLDLSAFSRRFSMTVGLSPSRWKSKS